MCKGKQFVEEKRRPLAGGKPHKAAVHHRAKSKSRWPAKRQFQAPIEPTNVNTCATFLHDTQYSTAIFTSFLFSRLFFHHRLVLSFVSFTLPSSLTCGLGNSTLLPFPLPSHSAVSAAFPSYLSRAHKVQGWQASTRRHGGHVARSCGLAQMPQGGERKGGKGGTK